MLTYKFSISILWRWYYGFKNVIYQVKGGEFAKQIQEVADGFWETLDVKHYVVITQNYNIDIITEWEPKIHVL